MYEEINKGIGRVKGWKIVDRTHRKKRGELNFVSWQNIKSKRKITLFSPYYNNPNYSVSFSDMGLGKLTPSKFRPFKYRDKSYKTLKAAQKAVKDFMITYPD